MPAWITVYLRSPRESYSSRVFKEGIDGADWWTLGEAVQLDEDEVNEFLEQLQLRDEPIEFQFDPKQRPIQVRVWLDSDRVQTEIAELGSRDGLEIPARVSDHLTHVRGVVGIELGWRQLQTMYEVVAFELAYWLAESGEGVILSPDDQWYDHDRHRWNLIKD